MANETNVLVAAETEVLEALTHILRGETGDGTAVRAADILRAAELLGKHYGLFSERVSGSITLPVIVCGEEDLA